MDKNRPNLRLIPGENKIPESLPSKEYISSLIQQVLIQEQLGNITDICITWKSQDKCWRTSKSCESVLELVGILEDIKLNALQGLYNNG